MKQDEMRDRQEGGEAGEREVLEGIERGMDPAYRDGPPRRDHWVA